MKGFRLFLVILVLGASACVDPGGTTEYVENNTVPVNPEATVAVNAAAAQQIIRGFGAANIIGWRSDLNAADRVTAFSVTDGLGLSVLRVRISPNSADWAANQATIDAAKSSGALVIASAWSAPADMKSNGNVIGGTLNPASYTGYAAHLSGFCTSVGGVDAVSPINEPNIRVDYESMEMTSAEVAAFVAAQGANCGAPVMAPEPYNMNQAYINGYLGNAAAAANTTYVAGHIYGATPTAFNPGKEIWMTEHYIDTATNGNDWNKALSVGKEIHDCMSAGYSMYVWWYVKRYYGPIEEDGVPTKTGHVMSQFAKFVRPNAYRVTATSNPLPNVHITAYTDGGRVMVVAVNRDTAGHKVTLNLSGVLPTQLTPFVSSYYRKCVQETAIPVTSGSAVLPLYAKTVITFVSD